MELKIDYNSYYFDVAPFIKAARALRCWCVLIVGARDRGKTYSTLKYAIEEKSEIIFLKRTVDDVKLLIASSKHPDKFDDDLSPYADLNADFALNVQPHKIYDGIASFYNEQDDNFFKCGYCFALSKVADFKGFGGLRECKYLVFDEFIKQPWEKTISRFEGEAALDLYWTASRDREQRGNDPLLFIGLANANDLSNPLFNVLEITDEVVDMIARHEDIRKIGGKLIVLVDDKKLTVAKDEKKSLIYEDLKDTTWGRVSFSNEFARNDISCIGVRSLKGMRPRACIKYKNEYWYIYEKDRFFYVCDSKSNNNNIKYYDLALESDLKPCYMRECNTLTQAMIRDKALFQKFRMYDVLIHFKKFFYF
jgi:hypothetical protein